MKIAIVELNNSHNECIYSQIKYLKSENNNKLSFIVNKELIKRVSYKEEFSDIYIADGESEKIKLLNIKNYIIKENFDKVIFNTAEGRQVKKLLKYKYPKNIEFIGTLHHTKKLTTNFDQKIISRKIKKYYILSSYLLKNIKQRYRRKLNFKVFYPIFFPHLRTIDINKPKNEIWITIPGSVELKRRDYLSLLSILKKKKLNKNLQFIFLGSSHHTNGAYSYVNDLIKNKTINNCIKLWDTFIDDETYNAYLTHSDYIMPLIHPEHKSFKFYKNRITGAFNLAFGYKKILLMHDYYNKNEDFINNSIFYNLDNLENILNSISIPNTTDKYSEQKWSFAFQAKNYCELLHK